MRLRTILVREAGEEHRLRMICVREAVEKHRLRTIVSGKPVKCVKDDPKW